MKALTHEKRISRRVGLICVCGHDGQHHNPDPCASCNCEYFRKKAFQPAELPPWRRIPGPLAYTSFTADAVKERK